MRNLIYSGNVLFGQCLCHGLSERPDVAFVRYSSDLDEVIDLAGQHRVTSVLVDLGDPDGAQALHALAVDLPDICLLALSVDDHMASEVIACARLGCRGIVPRQATLEDVIRIVRAAERGEVTIRPEVTAKLMQALAANDSREGMPACLTRREREICSLVCEGLTNKEIAREVNRSVGTVKNHVRAILSKLELPRRGAVPVYLNRHRAAGIRR